MNLDEQTKTNIFNAAQSLDSTYQGFNLDDFMQTVQTLAAWNTQGRTDNDLPGGGRPITDADRVRVMIDSGFNSSRAQMDKIRNEVEVQRLEILAERQLVEQKQADLEYEKQ